jgi:hypothetical protein
LYYYDQFDFPTMQSRPVASNFDVPDSDLTVTAIGSATRFEVTIPNQAPLSSGNSLVMLVFGNAATGTLSRVAFGTFGAEARIGGSAPLNGTGGVVLETTGETKVGDAAATITPTSLVLQIETSLLNGDTLLWAEVHSQDGPMNLSTGETPFWANMPTKVLFCADVVGDVTLPSPPTNAATPMGFVTGPQLKPRDITPPLWGPPHQRWQPNPPVPPAIMTDFDGDGSDDYQLPGGDILPGGGNIHFGCIVVDGAWLTSFLWQDRDGDGIIDRDEVIAVVGQCVFTNSANAFIVTKDASNHRHVIQTNYNKGPNTEHGVPKGGAIVYDYDVETGVLRVTKVIPYPDGVVTVLYTGPASGYDWQGI